MKEPFPLAWPEGRRRTLIGNRETRNAWKLTTLQYRNALGEELRKMGARHVVITSNIRPEMMGQRAAEPPDTGVAVYFVRPPSEDDFSWQEVLGIDSPAPSTVEIDAAFIRLSKMYHPDTQLTGDIDMFKRVGEARKRAKAWVTGDYGKDHEFIIECDRYKEVRHNMAAIRVAISALRKIEECGASGILERAWQSFAALTEGTQRDEHATASAR